MPALALRHRRLASQRGYTLMEILLVLSLMVLIAALAMPSVRGPLENHRLRKAADLVRAEWGRARVKAMESGRTYVFRYVVDEGGYKIEPWATSDDYLETSQLGVVTPGGSPPAAAATTTTAGAPTEGTSMRTKELPEDITFVASQNEQDVRDMLVAQEAMATTAVSDTDAPPIYFYADGTSSSSVLVLKNNRERYVTLTLRGLTGVVYVSDLQRAEELQ